MSKNGIESHENSPHVALPIFMTMLVTLIFCLAVALAPWPIAGNWPFVRTAFLIGGQLALLLAIIRPAPVAKRPLTLMLIFLALAAGLIWFQGSATSEPVQNILGYSIGIQETAPPLNRDVTDLSQGPISVYPAATRAKLVDYLLGIGWFFAASQLLRDQKSILRVLFAIAGVGVALSVFGILQNLSWNGKLYWTYNLISGGQPFGSFVNRNNAAGFLVITYSACLFFLALPLKRGLRQRQPKGLILSDSLWQSEKTSKKSFFEQLLGFVADLKPGHLYAVAALVITIAGVCSSLSRGGMLALATSILLAAALLFRSNRWLTIVGLLVVLSASAVFVFYSEQSTAISGQVETLYDIQAASTPRIAHWTDAWPFAVEHAITGVGAGTYRYVSPLFQTFYFEKVYAHAENVYLETLVEMGIAGILFLISITGLSVYAATTLLRRSDPFDNALGITGLVCLLGIAITSFLDFGIYQPANMIVLATLWGTVYGRSESSGKGKLKRGVAANQPAAVSTWVPRILMIGMFAANSWAIYESVGIESAKAGELALKGINASEMARSRLTTNAALSDIERNLKRAIQIRPDDADAHFQLGEYYLTRYRIDAAAETTRILLDELRANATISSDSSVDAGEIDAGDLADAGYTSTAIWRSTTVSAIHREARMAQRRNEPELLAKLQGSEPVQKWLAPAMTEYQRSEELCPLTSKTMFRLAQLNVLLTTGEDRESEYIDVALSRTFGSRQLAFDCGILALSSGDPTRATALWRQCLLNPYARAWQGPIVELAKSELPMRALFEEILPQNPENLLGVTIRYFSDPALAIPRELLLVHTRRVIESDESLDPAKRHFLLAEADRIDGNQIEATENYRIALQFDLDQPEWHFKYAESLYLVGDFDEAIRQLKICELSHGRFQPKIKPLLRRIRRDREKN